MMPVIIGVGLWGIQIITVKGADERIGVSETDMEPLVVACEPLPHGNMIFVAAVSLGPKGNGERFVGQINALSNGKVFVSAIKLCGLIDSTTLTGIGAIDTAAGAIVLMTALVLECDIAVGVGCVIQRQVENLTENGFLFFLIERRAAGARAEGNFYASHAGDLRLGQAANVADRQGVVEDLYVIQQAAEILAQGDVQGTGGGRAIVACSDDHAIEVE